ncbi:MAG: glycosyltransferase [Myxococcales bacterium]|jgi:glycosyltransferase involved in cell wall biosynthesis
MAPPALSVLLPARNAEPWLEEALGSIEAQTFGDFELLAVDDRSTDATRAILEQASRRDRRIRVITGPGTGICGALNAGLAECRAPFIARMDADDIALPRRFEAQLAALEADPRLAAVGSRVECFPREGLSEGFLAYEAWLNSLTASADLLRDRLIESPIVHPSAMLRAEPLRALGGWSSRGWPEDYALWLSLFERGHALANVAEVLLRWRDRGDRLTRTHPDYAMSAHVRLKAHHLARGALREGRCILWGAGKTGRAFYRALGERGVRVELFVDIDPRKIGRALHGARVVSPDELPPYSGVHLVAAVGAKGARALIREHLAKAGWREVEQFTCVG